MSASKIFDVVLGAMVLGTVGVLIGLSMGSGFSPCGSALGNFLSVPVSGIWAGDGSF